MSKEIKMSVEQNNEQPNWGFVVGLLILVALVWIGYDVVGIRHL
jgi:hypothetical protein